MIEIPNLELEQYHDQHELSRLQKQYARDSPDHTPVLYTETDRSSDTQQAELDLPLALAPAAEVHGILPLPSPGPPIPLQMRHTVLEVPSTQAYFPSPEEQDEVRQYIPVQEPITQVSQAQYDPIYENTDGFLITPNENPAKDTVNNVLYSDLSRELQIEPQEIQFDAPVPHDINEESIMNTVSDIDEPLDADSEEIIEQQLIAAETDYAPTPLQLLTIVAFTPPAAGSGNLSRVEPSPQLPPPLLTKLSRLAVVNSDEFNAMRKALVTEPKNPAEYTLHIVFTQFVRHAERKLNLCLEYPLNEEPPIIELLAEGVDPFFDNIVSSLGYIAKRKPKPVIDSVMFWRKLKSEVATMAALEVDKVVEAAKSASATHTPDSGFKMRSVSQGLPKISTSPKGKRSLSLMRTKSLSRLAHKKALSVSTNSTRPSAEIPNLYDKLRQLHIYEQQIVLARETAIQAERKSLASIYVLCRVLIEVVKQTSYEAMGDELGSKLEEIVYTQLKTTDPVSASESFVRLANWNLFAELLGHMSEKRFFSVSDRFIADLEKVPKVVKHTEEPHIHLLIHGMRYLKLKNYPLERFEESAEFVQSLTKFFANSLNHTIIIAYADVLCNLVLPLASVLTAEATHPLWVEAVSQIFNNAKKLRPSVSSAYSANGQGPAYIAANTASHSNSDWETSMNLMTAALAVSSKEMFAENWFGIIEGNADKLKPKSDIANKTRLMVSTARLAWVYVNRLPDTLNNTTKKLDRLFDILFFGPQVAGKKQQWLDFDLHLIAAIVEMIRVIGFPHMSYIVENVILRLLKAGFNGTSFEGFSPVKLIIVIKAYMLCLRDNRLSERPEFPTDEVINENVNFFREVTPLSSNGTSLQRWNSLAFDPKTIKHFATHEEICKSLAALLKLLDAECGNTNWSKSGAGSIASLYSRGFSMSSFGLDSSGQESKTHHEEVFAVLLDATSWSLAPLVIDKNSSTQIGLTSNGVIEILARNSIHDNPIIASAAVSALTKLASRKNAGNMITLLARIAFRITDKPGPHYDADYFHSENFIRILGIYVETLRCWLDQFGKEPNRVKPDDPVGEMMQNDVLNDLYQINHKNADLTNLEAPSSRLKPYEELEWKNIITIIEEVEGNGLYFLCSNDSRVRLYAILILKIVEQFDQSIYNNTEKELTPSSSSSNQLKGHSRSSSKFVADEGTRLIQVMENQDLLELLRLSPKELSLPERNRLSKLRNKKGLLLKFAASDYGIDSTIWFRVFPRLLDIFFEKCPMPVAICRSIVCVRLVQMHELVVKFSDNYRNYTSSIFGRTSSTPPELLVNQWKLYLIFACCSLTSTNEQKISFPSQPTHGRKKSIPMYIQHQKITSAKSVFRMVLPLLQFPQPMIRDAVIQGLSSININICRTLAENLPESLNDWENLRRKRDPGEDRLRIETVKVLGIVTSKFRGNNALYGDELTVANLVSIIKNVKTFLSILRIQELPEFQALRIHFATLLENFFIGLKDSLDLNRWLPFEARIGCFNFLNEWCGYGTASGIFEERYAIMNQVAQQSKEPATVVGILDLEKTQLQFATLSCMATICTGPLEQHITMPGRNAVISFDIKSVMSWVHEVIISDKAKVQAIGRKALQNILEHNINNNEIFDEVLKQCYSSANPTQVREIYFTNMTTAFMKHRTLNSMPYDVFSMATFLVGTDSYETRLAAIKCIKFIEQKFFEKSATEAYTERVCCSTMVVYKKVLFEISVSLAANHPQDAHIYISYLTKYFSVVNSPIRRDILACLLPWVQTVVLKYGEISEDGTLMSKIDEGSLIVLNNLFAIAVKFSLEILNEVEALWVALGTNPSNFEIIYNYVVDNCLERKNQKFVSYSRQIIAYLVNAKLDPTYLIEKLIKNLQPKAMVPQQNSEVRNDPKLDTSFYTASIAEVLKPAGKEVVFSLGQLSMIFLVDILRSDTEIMTQNLPLLLHVCFSLLDHYCSLVRDQAGLLLIYLVHSIATPSARTSLIIEALRRKDSEKNLWVYDDLNHDKGGGMTPKSMDLMVRNFLEVLLPVVPNLQVDWSRESLRWATTCAVRHIACRSFQIFRSLLSFLDQSMLKDMLHRLSNTVADESPDIQGFAVQILMTLNATTAELNAEKLINFPQLFWSSVACLSTIHEHEFIETISTMSKFVSKIDLDAPDTISCLTATFPPNWEGIFDGLQLTVLVGLRSATAWAPTMKFLDNLNLLQDSEIIGRGDQRLLYALLYNFPRFLHALEQKAVTSEISKACEQISRMATACDRHSLAKIMNSLAKNRFRSKKDFLVQTVSTIRTSFFPEYEAQALVFLLSLLSNRISWIKIETLSILKHILPLVDLQREEFLGVGADLISPLLRLLLTDHAEAALEVIDKAIAISGSQLDKDILRMSLGNASMRKEYEQTATLFGIPEESGWAIAMPAITAAKTRNNVHSVFATCGEQPINDENLKEAQADDNIQFLMEDYYAPPSEQETVDMHSVGVEEPAPSLSNMWAALDDFDSFFTEKTANQRTPLVPGASKNGMPFPTRPGFHVHSLSADTKNSNFSDLTSPTDSVPQVYDKKALVILNRSLARTQSNASFKSSLADFGSPTNFASNDGQVAKRSYLPFRSSRTARHKDPFTTPTLSSSANAFDQTPTSNLGRLSINTTSPATIVQMPSPSQERISPGEAGVDGNKVFDQILGGGKRRSKRTQHMR